MTTEPLLDITDLVVRFGPVRAVDGVSLQLPPGPFGLALVGESGSGKTTIGRAALRLVTAVGGTIRIAGKDVRRLRGRALKEYRRTAQIVFQDPDNSLDPRMRVGTSIAEALTAHRIASRASESPRALAGRLGASLGFTPAEREALERIALAEERARYAKAPAASGQLHSDVATVRRAMGKACRLPARCAAIALPASTLAPARTAMTNALDVFGWMDVVSGRLRQHGGQPARSGRA